MESDRPRKLPFRELALSWVWALVIVACSTGVALAFNALRDNGLPLVRRAPFDLYTDCPELSGEIPMITLRRLPVGAKKVVYMDARMALAHVTEHIPGALFMPMYPIDLPDFSTLANLPKGTWIVVYGTDNLQSNKRLVTALMGKTVRGVYLLEGGLKAWKAAGRPTVKQPPQVLSAPKALEFNPFYVDARDEDAFAAGSARGAVNLPFDTTLPPEKKVLARLRSMKRPLFVYDDGTKKDADSPALGVAADLMARGFTQVTVIEGGLPALKAAGIKIVKSKEAP